MWARRFEVKHVANDLVCLTFVDALLYLLIDFSILIPKLIAAKSKLILAALAGGGDITEVVKVKAVIPATKELGITGLRKLTIETSVLVFLCT